MTKEYPKRETYLYNENKIQIEYSIIGTGEPILLFHGGHSNCQEEFGYKEILENGYCIITPSRAGYGETSYIIGETLQTAIQAYAKLLEHLQLDKVHVIAVSAGGPSGIFFASCYPERVKSLTLQSAVTKEWLTSKDKEYKVAKMLFHPSVEKYTWKVMNTFNTLFPRFIFKQMVPSFSTLPYTEVTTYIEEDIEMIRQMNSRQRSGRGFMLDLMQTGDISNLDLQRITCPTLILHSKNDHAVQMEHPNHAHAYIPNSTLCILDTWGHLIWLGKGSEKTHEELIAFLKKSK
ncbi:putative hydrolase YcgS [Priestia taiwanensis]|uniref:Hydrolase YcgS n=2 Tax=Priestia taiwanensis TaxID=1347902 RepID=A0A917AMQ8_9BACI|nr:putative hydrolase YcgS [Priestia taiwanensis]